MRIRIYVNTFQLFISVCCLYHCGGEMTLTTAVIKESTYPKPTTLYRRINIDRNTDYKSIATQLHKLIDTRRSNSKNHASQMWNWDEWCLLQKSMGNCKEKLNRFYYDAQLDACLPFEYSGCGENKNNFETQVKCERFCKGVAHTVRLKIEQKKQCTFQPDIGQCLGYQKRYYYDINEATCKYFIYGGCGDVINSFTTKYKCLKTCMVDAT